MLVTADQLVAHAVGDYILQSDWMATEKTKKNIAGLVHVLTYTLPFLFLTFNPIALALIAGTHFIIDRWRLARYVCWIKNWVAIPEWSEEGYGGSFPLWNKVNKPWKECVATGYTPDKPPWLAVWLLIITDNTMHVLCNGLALWIFGG